jgi:multiple sugar transport system permease protein
VRVFAAAEFWPNLKTTIWYALFSTIFSIVVGLGAAMLMNVKFIGRGFFRGLLLFPYIAPVIAVAFTWAFLLDPFSGVINALLLKYGLADQPVLFLSQRTLPLDVAGLRIGVPLALTTVILFEVWRYAPFAFLFLLARLQALPAELNEASAVDGASPFQRFWYVTLPQLSGVMAVLFMLRFIWTFNKFDDIFLLTGGAAGTKTITIQVYDYAFALADLGTGAATALVLFAVLGLFLVIYFRWIEGRADAA